MSDSHRLKVGQKDLMCRNGCGFYGNPEWNWLCSQCYRKRNSSVPRYNFDAPSASPNVQQQQQHPQQLSVQLPSAYLAAASAASPLGGSSTGYPTQQYTPSPRMQSASLPAPLNKEKSSPFASMMGKSPALDRKLKIPSPQHVAQGISNKTKIFQSQTLDRSANIRQMFKKNQQKKEEKTDKSELITPETKLVGKEFGEYLSKRVKKSGMEDLSKNIQYFIKKVNKRIDDMKIEDVAAMVQNFYQELTKRLESHENFSGLSHEEIKCIEDYTERYVVISLYKQLFSPVSTNDEEKDLEIQSKIRSLNWVTATHLECPFKETEPEIRELIYTAINHVLEIDGSKAPQDKLRCVVSCAKSIFEILNKGGTVQGSADDFLPSLIYILLKANPPRVTSNINFITRFTNETRLRSGEEGYYFTNLCCAISFIENLSHESLSLPEDEFKLYMSGECVPPGSWESSLLMCEGIQTMSNNLKTLTDLEQMQEKLLQDAESLESQIQDWQDTMKSEVDSVLERTQYTLRGPKKAVNIDAELNNDNLSLPPPLLPEHCDRPQSPATLVDTTPISPHSSSQSDNETTMNSLDNFLNGPASLTLPASQENSQPSSLTNLPPKSLLDATPTEEQAMSPLLPVNLSPRGSPLHAASRSPEPPVNTSVSEVEVKSCIPVNGLASYVGFSAQAVSIPSISCSTAETAVHIKSADYSNTH